jgi:hypothetical protein
VRTLRQLRVADYRVMAEAVALAVVIEIALRATSVSTMLAWLDRLPSRRNSSAAPPSYHLDRYVAAAYRSLPTAMTCLRQSLVLYGLLRRRGASPRMCVGVRKDGAGLTAHAWVECEGISAAQNQSSFVELRAART